MIGGDFASAGCACANRGPGAKEGKRRMGSVIKKRRKKMRKHKYKKLRARNRHKRKRGK
jgi:hypothetical protein